MFKINTEKYIIRNFENETILLDVEKGQSHILDDIGTIIFNIIKEYPSDKALTILYDTFSNVDHSTIKKDYNKFINELIAKEIIINE